MIFGKKKKVEMPMVEDVPALPTLETLHQENFKPQPNPQKAMPQMPAMTPNPVPIPRPMPPMMKSQDTPKLIEEKVARPMFAPLFVKIDRYRNILNALGQLKTSIVMIRNSFSTLNELEKARFETLKLIEEAVGRLENKLSALDTELVRPAGFHSDASPEYQDVETVHATVADLKGQIEQLKSELDHIA